jgi:hypothetical protein
MDGARTVVSSLFILPAPRLTTGPAVAYCGVDAFIAQSGAVDGIAEAETSRPTRRVEEYAPFVRWAANNNTSVEG